MASTSAKNILLSQAKVGQIQEEGAPAQLNYHMLLEDEEMVIKVEIPGVDPSKVLVHCDASILYVDCERGTMTLPIEASLDTNDIKADIHWGLLTLRVPRRAARAVKINILETPAPRGKATGATKVSEES